jgi:putative transposase
MVRVFTCLHHSRKAKGFVEPLARFIFICQVSSPASGTIRLRTASDYFFTFDLMAIKHTQSEMEQTYFCTFTCKNWISLFEITDLYDEIYKWFNLLVQNEHQVCGFVIMPNHLHLLVHVAQGNSNINTILGNAKRFMAYEIVTRLEAAGRTDILQVLADGVTPNERNRKKKHRVFEVSSDIKPCYTEKFLLQKLNYIHANPLRGKWQLAESAETYPHSSAAFYALNREHPKIKITHYKDVGKSSESRIVPEAGGDT